MDRLTDEIRQEPLWTMTFANNIFICGNSRQQVGANLERWRYPLERTEINVSSWEQTKCHVCE